MGIASAEGTIRLRRGGLSQGRELGQLIGSSARWRAFDLGSRLSEFLSSLRPPTLAWSATAAVVVIFVQAAVITAVLIKERDASSGPSLAERDFNSTIPLASEPLVVFRRPLKEAVLEPDVQTQAAAAAVSAAPVKLSLSDEEIAALVAGGRQLIFAGDIPNARLVLQQAAEAGNSTAALELGATYDPFILQLPRRAGSTPVSAQMPSVSEQTRTVVADIAMAKAWYEKARDLGSAEAAVRLEKLRNVPGPGR